MKDIPKKSHHVRCPAFELLCTSICDPLTKKCEDPWFRTLEVRCYQPVVGLGLGGPEARLKKGPYDDVIILRQPWYSLLICLRYGHPRICSWDHVITEIAEGENAKGCSWYTTLKTLKVGKTKQHLKVKPIASWHRPTSLFSRPIFLHSPSINCKVCLFESFTPSFFKKMLGSWYPEFVHIHVFVGTNETIKNNQEVWNTKFVLNFIFNCKDIAYKSIQIETCFGKLWG